MAQSPAHRFGQIIGDVLEAALEPVLRKFAKDHHLYLDLKGHRDCRKGTNCTWRDSNGNTHDLDFVLERGGTPSQPGTPAAFIETAWRRYAKHSRNKVQEIQGAIEPLAQTYRNAHPFKGVVLAGVFTEGALVQLRSLRFTVLYIPYSTIVKVFQRFGVDAEFDERTLDSSFADKARAYERLSKRDRQTMADALLTAHAKDLQQFLASLQAVVSRQIERVLVLALHGINHGAATVAHALQFIESYEDNGEGKPIDRFEIELGYTNGDAIRGSFKDKAAAIDFLQTYLPP